MSNKLEGIVRPFAAGDVFTARVLPPVQPTVTKLAPVEFTWGNAINLQMAAIGVTNLFGGVNLSEVSRTTTTKRVSNPDDASQFVDVQQIQSLKLKDANGQIQNWTLNNPA